MWWGVRPGSHLRPLLLGFTLCNLILFPFVGSVIMNGRSYRIGDPTPLIVL